MICTSTSVMGQRVTALMICSSVKGQRIPCIADLYVPVWRDKESLQCCGPEAAQDGALPTPPPAPTFPPAHFPSPRHPPSLRHTSPAPGTHLPSGTLPQQQRQRGSKSCRPHHHHAHVHRYAHQTVHHARRPPALRRRVEAARGGDEAEGVDEGGVQGPWQGGRRLFFVPYSLAFRWANLRTRGCLGVSEGGWG